MADMDPRDIENLTNAIHELTDSLGEFSRAGVNLKGKLGDIKKELEQTTDKSLRGSEAIIKMGKSLNRISKDIEKSEKELESYRKVSSQSSSSAKKDLEKQAIARKKDLENQKRILTEKLENEKKSVDQILKERRRLEKEEKKILKEAEGTSKQKSPKSRRTPEGLKPSIRSKTERTRGEKWVGAFSEARQGFSNAFLPARSEGLGGFIKSSLEAPAKAGRSAGQLNEWAEASEGLKVLTKAVGGLSKALSFLSKAGWIGMVVSALVKVAKAFNTAEKFITKLNKAFLTMAGPTSGFSDVPNAMREFNKEIHNLRRNLKLGIMPKDIQEMFGAMSGAGMSLQGVKQNVGSYGKAIQEARALSIEFGTSMKDMGGMIAENMMTLRDSLDNVSQSFRKMAYDASKAGISSDKFYRIVNNATSSLSFFGNYLKTGSSLLTSFYKAGELGLKDAENAVSGIMKAFSGIDYKKGLKLINVLGGSKVKDLFGSIVKKDEEEIEKARKKLEFKSSQLYATEDESVRKKLSEEITALREDLEGKQARSGRLSKAFGAYNAGNPEELALQVGRLAEKPVETISLLMDKAKGYSLAEIEIMQNILGLTQEQTTYVKSLLETTKDNFKGFVTNNTKVLNKVFKGNVENINAFKELISARAAGATGAELNTVLGDFHKALKEAGIEEDEITTFMSSLNTNIDNNMIDPLVTLLDNIASGKAIGKALEGIDLKAAAIRSVEGRMSREDVKLMKSTDEKIAEIIKQTTTAEDYMDIMKESGKFFAADTVGNLKILTGLTASILGWVADIGRTVTADKREKARGIKEKLIEEELGKLGIQDKIKNRLNSASAEFKKIVGTDIGDEQLTKVLKGELGAKGLGVDEKKFEAFREQMKAKDAFEGNFKDLVKILGDYNKAIAEKKEDLVKKGVGSVYVEAKQEAEMQYQKGFSAGKSVSESFKNKTLKESANKLSIKPDFKTTRGGLALLNRDDMVFRPPAAGVAGAAGTMTPKVMKEIFPANSLKGGGGASSVKYEVNLGGLNINGDVADPAVVRKAAQNIGDMVLQAIRKDNYKKQMAGG